MMFFLGGSAYFAHGPSACWYFSHGPPLNLLPAIRIGWVTALNRYPSSTVPGCGPAFDCGVGFAAPCARSNASYTRSAFTLRGLSALKTDLRATSKSAFVTGPVGLLMRLLACGRVAVSLQVRVSELAR